MIFGGPHVYTFDGTYYTFPGYKKPNCMYVLARDVRDNKFTIMSQETAILVVTKDSSVKIYQDGRVETIVKVSIETFGTVRDWSTELYLANLHHVKSKIQLNMYLMLLVIHARYWGPHPMDKRQLDIFSNHRRKPTTLRRILRSAEK